MSNYGEDPRKDSPTYGLELLIESAREDIISHVVDVCVIVLLAEGYWIIGSLLAIYAVFQFFYALGKEFKLRAYRMDIAKQKLENDKENNPEETTKP